MPIPTQEAIDALVKRALPYALELQKVIGNTHRQHLPVDVIVSAIVGALAKLVEPAVKDGYEALKALIRRKAGPKSEVAESLEKLEAKADSEGRQKTLGEEIEASGLKRDDDVMRLVEKLIASLSNPDQASTSVVQDVRGDGNNFSGTGAVVVNNFLRPDQKP